MKQDTLNLIRDCENAVHEAFKDHSGDPRALSNRMGALYTEYGQDAVMAAMTSCMQIAYLRNHFQS